MDEHKHSSAKIRYYSSKVLYTRFSLSMEMSRLTRDGTAEPVSRDQILRHARGLGNIHFPCSADHEQGWQPYPVDPYSAICDDHTYTMFRTTHRLRTDVLSFAGYQNSTNFKLASLGMRGAQERALLFMMTKEGTFTMISRVVVVRHLGGLLCAVGPMVLLFNLSSLHPRGS